MWKEEVWEEEEKEEVGRVQCSKNKNPTRGVVGNNHINDNDNDNNNNIIIIIIFNN